MNELQAQLDEVNAQIAAEQAKGAQRDADVLAGLEQKQAEILLNMDAEKAKAEQEAAQNVRIQAQEVKVESITLPYNFNEIFDNTKADAMIIEVVKEFQRKAYEDHNAEIQTLTDGHKEREANLKFQLEQSYKIVDNGKREYAELHETYISELSGRDDKISELTRELDSIKDSHFKLSGTALDNESKRDAAVKQLEEAQAEIAQLKSWNDDLRAQAAQGVRKAIDVIDISPSEKLALMVKETNEQKANRGLARWAEMMPEVVAPPVVPAGTAVFQPDQAVIPANQLDQTGPIPIPTDHQEVAAPAVQFQGEVQVAHGLSIEDGQGEQKVSRQEFEALKSRVSFIEAHGNIPTDLRTAV